MLSQRLFRAAAHGARQSGSARAALLAGKAQCASSTLPMQGRRSISLYGYTQAKALVYSKYGEPKDVLRCASPFLYFLSQIGYFMVNQHS